jgi:YVTN family beta-propeller protein
MKKLPMALTATLLLLLPQAFSQKILTTIQIGGVTGTPAVNTATNLIYVPNTTTGAVAVIDGRTNAIVANIPVGISPVYAVVNSDTNVIYIGGGQGPDYIAVIDGASNTLTTTVSVPSAGPMALNAVANLIYFLSGNGTLSVLDGATNVVIKTITVSKGCCTQMVSYSPVTNHIYVPMTPHALVIADASTYSFSTFQFPQIIELTAALPDSTSNRLYLSDGGGNGLFVINGNDGKVMTSLFPGCFGPVAYSPSSHLIADFGFSSATQSEFLGFANGRTYRSVGNDLSFPVGSSPYTLTPSTGNRFYATFYQRDGIAVVSGPQASGTTKATSTR